MVTAADHLDSPLGESISYRDAGVDIDEADRAVSAIRKMAQSTYTKGVLSDIGSFGGCFSLPRMKRPVLVSSVDGVGTKLKIAFATGKHDTIGEDLVNHCVNDIAVLGAKPLFFLDYLAVGKLDADVATSVISGIARGCARNGCALIGGETAEMPGLYADGEYDLAGTIVGVVEKSKIITGAKVREGDPLLALASNGLHTNGYSLARKLLFEVARLKPESHVEDLGGDLAVELLKTHRSYLKAVETLMKGGFLSAAAHITGGGITDNLPRVLPKGLAASIDTRSWQVPPLFSLLQKIGQVPEEDWRRTFNIGVGMIFAVPRNSPREIGSRSETGRRKTMGDWGSDWAAQAERPRRIQLKHSLRLGVLISGRGSNLEAIANSIQRGRLDAEIAIVISNRAGAPGVDFATQRGLPVRIIASAGLERDVYDKMLIDELQTHEVDLVCLAGFMRLLSAGFVRAFPEKVLNISSVFTALFSGPGRPTAGSRTRSQDYRVHSSYRG